MEAKDLTWNNNIHRTVEACHHINRNVNDDTSQSCACWTESASVQTFCKSKMPVDACFANEECFTNDDDDSSKSETEDEDNVDFDDRSAAEAMPATQANGEEKLFCALPDTGISLLFFRNKRCNQESQVESYAQQEHQRAWLQDFSWCFPH